MKMLLSTLPISRIDKRAASQLSVYFGSKLLPGLLLFVSIPLILRIFGADVYGSYARIWAFGLVSTSLTTGWLRQAILRQAGRKARGLENLPARVLTVVILAGSLPVLIYAAALDVGTGAVWYTIVGLYGVSSSAYSVSAAVVQRDQQISRFGCAEIVRVLGTAYLPLLAMHAPASGVGILLSGAIIGNLFGLVLTSNWQSFGTRAPCVGLATEFWNYGWPMSIWLACSSAILYSDRFIVQIFTDPVTSGQYAAVSDLVVRGVTMVSFPITMAAHPKLMALANNHSFEVVQASIRQWSIVLYSVMAIVGLGLCAFGEQLSQLALRSYDLGLPLLIFIGLAACLWQAALMAHKIHEVLNLTQLMLRYIAVALTAAVGSGSLLAIQFGPVGASMGACIGPIVYLLLIVISKRRLLAGI